MNSENKVKINNEQIPKPFIGGFYKVFQDKRIELHNAFSQTGPSLKNTLLLESRESQTIYVRNRTINTKKSEYSQTNTDGDFLKTLNVKQFESLEQYNTRVQLLEKIIFLQKSYRKMKFRKWLKSLLEKCRQSIDKRNYENRLKYQQKLNEIMHKFHPKNETDFKVLYNLIENWVQKKHSKNFDHNSQMLLIEKEIEMLKKLDKQFEYFLVNKNKRKPMLKLIKNLSEPIQWLNYRNLTVSMVPIYMDENIQKIWNHLTNQDTDNEILIMILNYCLKTLNQLNNCNKKIFFLINQIEILINQLKSSIIGTNFRKNIQLIYIEYLKILNIENLLPSTIRNMTCLKLLYCNRCRNLKKPLDFASTEFQKSNMKTCKQCSWVNRTKRLDWIDFKTFYQKLLNEIRDLEFMKFPNQSLEIFCVNESDIHYLFERIWHNRSIISDKTEQLTLARWNIKQPWSPWNCLLITQNEYDEHCLITIDLSQAYCSEFIETVRIRNFFAKEKFYEKLCNEMKILNKLELI